MFENFQYLATGRPKLAVLLCVNFFGREGHCVFMGAELQGLIKKELTGPKKQNPKMSWATALAQPLLSTQLGIRSRALSVGFGYPQPPF